MGTSSSKTSTNIYTKNVANALSRSIQNCTGTTAINQQVTIRGNNNVVRGVRLVQGMKLSNKCSFDQKSMQEIQATVENAIKQQAEAQNVALMGALTSSSSVSETDIHNEVVATITQESVQNIVNDFNAKQEFFLDGNSNIVEDITMEQSMEILNEGSMKLINEMSVITKMNNAVDQTAKSTQTNPVAEILETLGDIFTELGGLWTIIIVVALVIGGYVLVNSGILSSLFGGDDGPANQQQMQNQQMLMQRMGMQRPMGQQMPYGRQMPMGQQMPYGQPPMQQYGQPPMQQYGQPPMQPIYRGP